MSSSAASRDRCTRFSARVRAESSDRATASSRQLGGASAATSSPDALFGTRAAYLSAARGRLTLSPSGTGCLVARVTPARAALVTLSDHDTLVIVGRHGDPRLRGAVRPPQRRAAPRPPPVGASQDTH